MKLPWTPRAGAYHDPPRPVAHALVYKDLAKMGAKGKTVHLLRHAKAEPGGARDTVEQDHARALAKRGEKAAAALAAHMKDTGFTVDRIYCSTAVRARQTLEPVR